MHRVGQELQLLSEGIIHFRSKSTPSLPIMDIRYPSNYPGYLQLFDGLKAKESPGLAKRGVYKIVSHVDLVSNVSHSMLQSHFFLCTKNTEASEELHKSRWVVQGLAYIVIHLVVQNSTILRKSSTPIPVALAVTFGFPVWSQGVFQAYLQSAEKLMRDIHFRRTTNFRLSENRLLRFLKPV